MNLIVAICKKNNGIGFKGGLPWHLKQDLKYLKEVQHMEISTQM